MQLQTEELEPFLDSIPETGRLLNVGRTKVYDLIHRGELETVHIDKYHLVIRDSTERLVKRRAQKAAE